MKIAAYSPTKEQERREWTGEVFRERSAESGRSVPALNLARKSFGLKPAR